MSNISLALVLAFLVAAPSVLACGGGGSGSYRKPARPDQHQHGTSTPAMDQRSTAPKNPPQ